MESQLLGAAREIPSLTVASLHGEIRREVRDAAATCKLALATGGSLQCLSRGGVLGLAVRLFGDGLGLISHCRGILVASLRRRPGTLQHHAKRCGGAGGGCWVWGDGRRGRRT